MSSNPLDSTHIVAGSTVSLHCDVAINPFDNWLQSVDITWTGPRLSRSNEGYNITQSSARLDFTSVLTISNVAKEDEGKYECEVHTVSGNVQSVMSLPANSSILLGVVAGE